MNQCNKCHKSFPVANWNRKRKFCSHLCYWKSLIGKPSLKKIHVRKVCETCQQEYEVPVKGKAREGRRFCSIKCRKIVPWNTGTKGVHFSPSTEFKKGMIAPMKGRKFTKEHVRKMIESRQRNKKQMGENHYNWRGGLSFLPYNPEFSNELKS